MAKSPQRRRGRSLKAKILWLTGIILALVAFVQALTVLWVVSQGLLKAIAGA